MDWSGLLFIGFGIFIAWMSWRFGIQNYESFYKMTRNRAPDPESLNFRIARFNRWLVVVFGSFIAVAGVDILFGDMYRR